MTLLLIMSTSQQSKTEDPRIEYLIFGYIRQIQQLINYQIIPTPIIELCLNYYPILPKWLTYNTDKFIVSNDGLTIKGKHDGEFDCRAYTQYILVIMVKMVIMIKVLIKEYIIYLLNIIIIKIIAEQFVFVQLVL